MSTRKALALSFLDRYSGLVLHTASAMVVARLLTPSEIGVYSVTMVLLGFVATFRDLGAGQYLVQQKELTPERIRATWSVQLGLGLFIALLILASAIPAATFYNEPRMLDIMLVLALNFAITPFLAFPYAWLARDMRFGTIAIIRFVGSVVHAGASIGLAWSGHGPISLAWANALTTLSGILAVWLIARPSMHWKPTLKGIAEVVSFGGKLTLNSLMNTLAMGAPELFLGKLQTMSAAGQFSRALGLVTMFQRLVMDAVNAVALPYFAKQFRESRDFADSFIVAMELVTGLGWAFFSGICVLAYPAIHILYGDQWGDAVNPTRWLALAYAIGIPSAVCYTPLIAIGAATDTLKITVVATLLYVAATFAGAALDLVSLSQLLVVAASISVCLWLRMAKKRIGFPLKALFHCWLKSLWLAIGAIAVPMATMMQMGWRSPDVLTTTCISVPGGAIGFLLAAYVTKHQVWNEISKVIYRRGPT
ncbi:putative Membrane protein involved in the export of O-antigen and teichoic acid [Candidatus Propionivibrio aalborgensis]|uniref:Putative Membrane protein involved in the export of O-antigen and teichoic acid n=2 Tax=Candidatus Propionivibrio aalborgensis TaxID=1860101 RepID=A0A1A8XKG8_9RHOO|nr:putative Membrane protein involved in the export of O-antigen and teichoic acid [Candidatus Propionivibrio aalborgensis]